MPLLPVRALDVVECDDDHPDGVVCQVFHAFGAVHQPVPTEARVRVEPHDQNIRVNVRVYMDPRGVTRFSPAMPILHTNN